MAESHRSLYRFSWGIVFYTVVVIAWGAWVRISGSGDGCGDHWPLCHGEAIPTAAPVKTWIEVSHRYSTALYGLLVLTQILLVWRVTPRIPSALRWSLATLFFTVTEALIGRQLVALKLVNQSTDTLRLFIMPLHLVNTSLLLLSTVMAAESIMHGARRIRSLPRPVKRAGLFAILALAALLTTGAIAALGSHLSPSESLSSGLAKDLSINSHLAVRLRFIHPLLALLLGVALFQLSVTLREHSAHPELRTWVKRFQVTLVTTVAIGVTTLLALAPAWLKLTHLTLANALVIVTAGCIFHSRTDSN